MGRGEGEGAVNGERRRGGEIFGDGIDGADTTFQGVAPVGQGEDPAVASSNERASSDARPILSHGAQVRPLGLPSPLFLPSLGPWKI
jgi:hypothetical protein